MLLHFKILIVDMTPPNILRSLSKAKICKRYEKGVRHTLEEDVMADKV